MDKSAVQVPGAFGVRMTSVGRQKTDLSRRSNSVSTIVMREPGHNWTTGLRAVGASRSRSLRPAAPCVADIFVYLVLLWGLTRAGRDYTAAGRELPAAVGGSQEGGHRHRRRVCWPGHLSFGYALLYELVQTPRLKAPALAGPVGLAVAAQ